MHYHAKLWLPSDQDIEQQVSAALEPYREAYNETTEDLTGWWDWFQIGGRWTGTHMPDYNPETDPKNIEACDFCRQTGMREWPEDGLMVKRPCNGCSSIDPDNPGVPSYPYGIGKRLKWPTKWAAFPLDIIPADAVQADLSPYTFVSKEHSLCLQKKTWNGEDFVEGEIKGRTVKQLLSDYNIVGGYLVTVDYHS